MGSHKPRRLTCMVLGMLLILSVLSVMSIVTINAQALTWNGGHIVSSNEWHNNTTISILNGNLSIRNNAELTLDNVTLDILCSFDGEYGIYIDKGGKFTINNDYDNSTLTYSSSPAYSYFFVNNGTIDFLGATVVSVFLFPPPP